MSDAARVRYPVWVRGDLDGFFGLMVDNLAQVLLIVALCHEVAGLPNTLIFGRILPAVAISLVIGNLFYGLQAHWVARRHRNPTCTALPYGINTPTVFAFVLFVMGPIYREKLSEVGPEQAAHLAWLAGLAACMVSGIIEFAGAFFAERLRRVTPRAALLGVLAAVGIAFIAADFAFRMWTRPLVGVLPLAFLLLAYFARYRFPLRIPGGFLAILFGTAIAWLVTWLEGGRVSGEVVANWLGGSPGRSLEAVREALSQARWTPPVFCGDALTALFAPENRHLLLRFLAVSIPMGVLNVIGSLQNIESAEAGGDRFATTPSLTVNGLGTIGAALFGSCFPTTIYIGHPGWKALGAQAGYSIVNGVFFTVCFLFGLGNLLVALIPIEAGAAIVMYIGIIITAQAFQATPRAHAPAVALALFPVLAALLITKLGLFLADSGATRTLADLVSNIGPATQEPTVPGMVALMGANSSWIVLTLVLTAIGATLIDRRYWAATVWAAAATVLTALGVLHAYCLIGSDVHELFVWQALPDPGEAVMFAYRAYPIAIGYGLMTLLLLLVALRSGRQGSQAARMPGAIPERDDELERGSAPDAG